MLFLSLVSVYFSYLEWPPQIIIQFSSQGLHSLKDNKNDVVMNPKTPITVLIGANKNKKKDPADEKQTKSQLKQISTPNPNLPVFRDTFIGFYYYITSIEIEISI